MKVEEQIKITWKADDWSEFCIMKDLLKLAGVNHYEESWEKDLEREGAKFNTDMDTLEVFIKDLEEEDVQAFGKIADARRILKSFKVTLRGIEE